MRMTIRPLPSLNKNDPVQESIQEQERFIDNSSPRPFRKSIVAPINNAFPKPARQLYDSNEEISWRSIKPPTGYV